MGFTLYSYRWSLIAGRLPGRTDNEIKNYWNTHIRRKLLNRGIDPATHRPLNEPAQDATTISFAAAPSKQEPLDDAISTVLGYKNENNPTTTTTATVQERCPDLNLELRISPPYQQHHQPDASTGMVERNHCFACSLGTQNSEECSCRRGASGGSSARGGYDFLGLKTSVLDFRTLEMK